MNKTIAEVLAERFESMESRIAELEREASDSRIDQEKLDWLESIGAKEFEHPLKWTVYGKVRYSEHYIRNTPLEILKEKYEQNKRMFNGAHNNGVVPSEEDYI